MKKLLESRGTRVLAFILCLVFGLLTAVTGVFALYVYYEPGFERDAELNFYESELASDYVGRYAWAALDIYQNTGESYQPDPGYSYIIRRGDEVLMDTTGYASVRVPGLQTYGTWGMKEEELLTIENYVNYIQGQRSRLNSYVHLYDYLYNGRTAFLPLAIAGAIITLLLFVFLMAAAGRVPDGVRLGGLHRWPLEIYGGGLILCVVAAAFFLIELGESWNFPDGLSLAGMGTCILVLARRLSGQAAITHPVRNRRAY